MKISLILIILSLAVIGSSQSIPFADFNANSKAAAASLQQWYNNTGLWDTTGWWNAANCVEALENIIVADNGRPYVPVLANTLKLNCRSNYLNEYYDDEGWWALAWTRAYDLTGKPQYLKTAKVIFNDLTNGWSSRCDGGLIWRKNHLSKNAIPNELFLLAAIRLHQRTPHDAGNGSYLDWALKEWMWFKNTGMINSENLVNDGLNRNCENDGKTTWTYNQGVILGGLTDLYKTTGDTNYLYQAMAIAHAAITTLVDANGVLREPCEDGDCGADAPQFKGIFIHYLTYLYDETHDPSYLKFLLKNAQSVWTNDRNDANQLGLKWDGPFDSADAARQSSAMMALSALAEPMTENLPFAKGAGSVSFSHDVGDSSGTLAWKCNDTTGAGIMLSGTCASLTAGKHIIHFRLAANEVKNSGDNLIGLFVKNGNSIFAGRQISWNCFTTSGEAQNFQLTFTNLAADAPLQFQIDWNHVPNAPQVTVSDITVDGSHNWTAANLQHDIGQLDGLNSWESDPIRDRVSGYLVKGPDTDELPCGKYSACFELKVDNFNWDKSEVATLSVAEADTGKVIASRIVKRNQFSDTLYHTFTLKFSALTGKRYGFRTFWHYTPTAPRLTQRTVVVRPR